MQQLFRLSAGLLIALQLTLVSPLAIPTAQASVFDPSFILTNSDLEAYQSMTLGEIQAFLNNLNSFLATYVTLNSQGVAQSAAEIIYSAAQQHRINPKWILVTLQKEQSLIASQETPIQDRLDWAMGYGVCDSCSKDDPRIQKFRGFGNQVDRAAARVRQYIEQPQQFYFKPGNTYTIGDQIVTIKNLATATLYTYTPHIHGNFNFWRIWSRWFSAYYPDGSLVQVEGEPGVWYITNGMRRAITSKAVLVSRFDPTTIRKVSKLDLEKYPKGASLRFPNYTLVTDQLQNRYLLVNDEKRRFESQEVFARLGFNPEELELVSTTDLEPYADGPTITLGSAYPLGQLIQEKESGGVYWVENGLKHPIVSREILKVNFPTRSITQGDHQTLAGFPTGSRVALRDGTLVKSADSPMVYVISNGNRRPIANETTFVRLGYQWNAIVTTSQQAIEVHPLDEILDVTLPDSPVQIAGQ